MLAIVSWPQWVKAAVSIEQLDMSQKEGRIESYVLCIDISCVFIKIFSLKSRDIANVYMTETH